MFREGNKTRGVKKTIYIYYGKTETGRLVVGEVKKVKISRVIAITADNMGYDIPLHMIEKILASQI